MLMLNEKSCIDCDEFEFEKHSEEIEELMEKLIKLEDYDCVVLHKYIDLAHKDKERGEPCQGADIHACANAKVQR